MPGLQCMILTTLFAYNIRFRVCYDIIHFISCLMDDTCTSITFLSAAIIGPALSVCLVERWCSVSCSERAPVRFLFLPVRAISTGRVAGLPADWCIRSSGFETSNEATVWGLCQAYVCSSLRKSSSTAVIRRLRWWATANLFAYLHYDFLYCINKEYYYFQRTISSQIAWWYMERDSALFGAIRQTLKNILRLYLSDSAYSS